MTIETKDIRVGSEVVLCRNGIPSEIRRVVANSKYGIEIENNGSIVMAFEHDGTGKGRFAGGVSIEAATPENRAAVKAEQDRKEREHKEYLARRERPEFKLLQRIQAELEHNIEYYDSLPIERIIAACESLGIDHKL